MDDLKKFWEWCGFHYEDYNTPTMPHQGGEWLSSQGHPADDTGELPELTLDNLFKYAVPKLRELGYGVRLQASELRDNDTGKVIFKWTYYAMIFYTHYDNIPKRWRNIEEFNCDPAQALYKAIQEVINDK
jgi:hypothetical protein